MNGYTESNAKVKARWEARKKRDDEILTARANHAACLLAETMRDCDNCKFQPDVLPWEVISDTVAVYPELKFGDVVFDISAIAENIRTRSGELKSKIDARATAARERMGERH